ncbi:hypothetical protein HRH25_01990 [Flavisolibacter sp. BT320]|nr:hypothetical protein [Flavisolibacter longurius]
MRRMSYSNRAVLSVCFSFFAFALSAQSVTDLTCKPPISRRLWHDNVDKAQAAVLKSGLAKGDNDDVVHYVNHALIQQVNALQCSIDSDSMGDQRKIGYLRGLERMLRKVSTDFRSRTFTPSNLPILLTAYNDAIQQDKKIQSIEAIVDRQEYEVANVLLASQAFDGNPGLRSVQNKVVLKFATLYPDKVFITLKDNPDVPFRDSLIKIAGHKNPRQLYDYAAADNKLGYAIRSIDDPIIRTISKMAKSTSGQLYFPFLDNLIKGRQTIDEIEAVKDDPVKYYKLLVKTRMDYVQRQLEGEKIMEMKALQAMLTKKGLDNFIKSINDLHEVENPAVRFAALNPLTAQELYYLVIAGETDLYTSSYTKGVYPRLMQKIGNRGDSLLMSVGFDYFKKFIKVAAGYNTLTNFLASFPDGDRARVLMTAFVNNLDKSDGLEDGVDVADSYASIAETMKPVADQMLANVRLNYEEAARSNNKRGLVIYDLLYKLFRSSEDTTIDLSREFNIPPVYSVNYKTLAGGSDSGQVVIQVFFYGDKDGRMNYANFVPQFSSSLWRREENRQWITFTSIKGRPIKIFANKPLDEVSGEVDRAQAALGDYLAEKGLEPTVVIHRGHSYYAPYTIEQLAPTAKIVFMGSCGGYNVIHDVLEHAEDAHIISSKQIGKLVFNQPLIDMMMENLRTGKNIDWIPFWREFERKYKNIDGFGDYVPPHKNLGAIFIKAYKNAMGGEERGA